MAGNHVDYAAYAIKIELPAAITGYIRVDFIPEALITCQEALIDSSLVPEGLRLRYILVVALFFESIDLVVYISAICIKVSINLPC
jgi:hypothetical protein